MTYHKVYVFPKKEYAEILFHGSLVADSRAEQRRLVKETKKDVAVCVWKATAFGIEGDYCEEQVHAVSREVLCHPITEVYSVHKPFSLIEGKWGRLEEEYNYVVEIKTLPGVTDNLAKTAIEGMNDFLQKQGENRGSFDDKTSLYASRMYFIRTQKEVNELKQTVVKDWYNPLIESYKMVLRKEFEEGVLHQHTEEVLDQKTSFLYQKEGKKQLYEAIDIELPDKELMVIAEKRCWALTLEELHSIQRHYADSEVQKERRQKNLPFSPTDVEIEAIAQTWSEHCKHKIFSSTIEYTDKTHPNPNASNDSNEKASKKTINSLYKTYIQGITRQLKAERPDILSVFSDNAGVFRFDERHAICVKVETHNSPSALEPYGGAITGIVGVNRDIIGTGKGAKPIFNTDVFCFGNPGQKASFISFSPEKMLQRVHKGIQDGGNQSGIPTVNGAIVFHDSFLERPLVFCGSGGIMPIHLHQKPSVEKVICNTDLIVMVGGKIGKDGIHGATVSSQALKKGISASVVQIADPIIQKKMTDYLLEARDKGFYRTLTDNGAGGLSSSVGEMALLSGGCRLYLEKAPLKTKGLQPWEILVSESQERMTVAVPVEQKAAFEELSQKHDVEISFLGEFTDTGIFEVFYGEQIVAFLPLKEFLHEGVPTLHLEATWDVLDQRADFLETLDVFKKTPFEGDFSFLKSKAEKEAYYTDLFQELYAGDHNKLLLEMMQQPNVVSKEWWVRQYDHEVQGRTILKPYAGVEMDGPMDAAVMRPVYHSDKGLVIGSGICPKYSYRDTYHMVQCCVDEALRNVVAVGGDPSSVVGLDNFCWPDPVQAEDNPGGSFRLGQLVRANEGLMDICLHYKVPLISGKDSMKNNYQATNNQGKEYKKGITPTFLFTAVGTMPSIETIVSSDFKRSDSHLYVVGITKDERGGSELMHLFQEKAREAKNMDESLSKVDLSTPEVDCRTNRSVYEWMYQMGQKGFLGAVHDLSDGGLAVGVAESAIGGRKGCEIYLDAFLASHVKQKQKETIDVLTALYSESQGRFVIEIFPENEDAFLRAAEKVFDQVADNDSLEKKFKTETRSMPLKWLTKIGKTDASNRLRFVSRKTKISDLVVYIDVSIQEVKQAWKRSLVS